MARMMRKTREFRWQCACCSIDPPTRVAGKGKRRSVNRRIMRHLARRREERRWVREARDDA